MGERPFFSGHIKEFSLNDSKSFFTQLDDDAIRYIAAREQLELLGQGGYSAVFALDQERVFAMDKKGLFARNPHMAELEYNYQVILQTVYPEHFPVFYASYPFFIDEHGNMDRGGTVRERIYTRATQKTSDTLTFYPHNKSDLGDIYGYLAICGRAIPTFVPEVIVATMLEWREGGIPLALDYGKAEHFVEDRNGRIIYIDTPHIFGGEVLVWQTDRIERLMQSKNFSSDIIESITALALRYQHLEERANITAWIAKKLMYLHDEEAFSILDNTDFDGWVRLTYKETYPLLDASDIEYIKLQRWIYQRMYAGIIAKTQKR